MDTKKLDKWADLLLDTGKRNNLINFKDTRASTVEVLLPSSDVLFEKVDGTVSFEVFDPKIVEEDDDTEESCAPEQLQIGTPEEPSEPEQLQIGTPEESSEPEQLQIEVSEKADTSGGKAAFLAQYSGKIKRQNQILLYNAATNPLTAVKNIDKKAREFIEETGVNVAYMAFGFVHWKESAASNYVFRAPILLVPIRLEQASAVEPYFIKSAEDDIIVNPTFSYKMDAEHGVKLPEYNDEGLTAYLEKAEAKPVDGQPTETFEEVAVEKHFEFPSYKAADFFEVCRRHHYRDFKAIVKEILEVEAPLSEDLFLKRIVWYFEREKVTNVVQRAYEQQMYGYQRYGIIRRNGFLYLDNGKEIQFRGPGDIERDIKQIAPEELAAGMFEILKQNVTADKSGLYRSLAAQCGVTRVGKAINEAMDTALSILADKVSVSGEAISVRQ